MGRVVRFLSVLLVVPFVASASAVGRASSAARQAAPSFALYGCSTDPGGFSKLDSLQGYLRKFVSDLHKQVFVADEDVQMQLIEADGWAKQNTARMIDEANSALAAVSDYRSKLDALGLDLDAMQRGSHVTGKRGVASLLEAGLGRIDGGISKLYQAGNYWEAAAKAFLAYSYDEALTQMQSAALTYNDAVSALYAGFSQISSAISAVEQASPCRDTDAVAPLSATQISRATGGAGTQRSGRGEFSIVAPKRLTLKKQGPTKLPMTLQASDRGRIELWLTRGNKLVTNIHAWAFKQSKFGLRIEVPHSAAHGKLTLKLTFISGDEVDPTETINVSIPLA